MFFIVLVHESSTVESIYFIQSEDTNDIPEMIKQGRDTLEIIQIPEPVWKAMIYTDKLIYKTVRPQ